MFKYIAGVFLILSFTGIAFGKEIKNDWMGSYTMEASGEYEKAASLLIPYMREGEVSEFATLRYAWLNYLQGNFNDAVRNYQKAMEQNPRSIDAKLGIALPLIAQQRWREAMRYIRQILTKAPLNYTAHVRLMMCEEGLRDWKELEKHARTVAAFYPTDASALVYLARSYAWQGKVLLAKSAYNKVLIRMPSHLEALQYVKNHP